MDKESFIDDDLPPMKSADEPFIQENFVFEVVKRNSLRVKRTFTTGVRVTRELVAVAADPTITRREREIEHEFNTSPTVQRRLTPIHRKRKHKPKVLEEYFLLSEDSEFD